VIQIALTQIRRYILFPQVIRTIMNVNVVLLYPLKDWLIAISIAWLYWHLYRKNNQKRKESDILTKSPKINEDTRVIAPTSKNVTETKSFLQVLETNNDYF
jgi:hypothetical protein